MTRRGALIRKVCDSGEIVPDIETGKTVSEITEFNEYRQALKKTFKDVMELQ